MQQKKREQDKPFAKIDGYELFVRNGAYYVRFSDSNHVIQEAKVTKNQFAAFLKSVAQAKKEKNEQDRHIEQSELTEATLQRRMTNKPLSLDERLIADIENERLRQAIKKLPELSQKRIYLYFYEQMTLEQIARIEGIEIYPVWISIQIALKKLRTILGENDSLFFGVSRFAIPVS